MTLNVNNLIGFGVGGRGQVQLVGYKTATDTGGGAFSVALTSLSGGLGGDAQAGDYVIVLFVHADNIDAALQCNTAGFDVIGTELLGNDSFRTNTELYAKRMTSTPDTSVEVQAPSDSGEAGVAIARVYRGVDPVTPLDVAVQTVAPSGPNTVLFDPPAITPVTNGAVVVVAGGGAHAEGDQTFANSSLSNVISDGSDGVDRDASAIMGDFAWESGAFNPSACTFTGSDAATYSYAGYTLALRPA